MHLLTALLARAYQYVFCSYLLRRTSITTIATTKIATTPISSHDHNGNDDFEGVVDIVDVVVIGVNVVVETWVVLVVEGDVAGIVVVVLVVVTGVTVIVDIGVVVDVVVTGVCVPISAKDVKCATAAVTSLFWESTVLASFCQEVPSHQATYKDDPGTLAGKLAGSYLKLTLIAGLKVAPVGPNSTEEMTTLPAGGAGRLVVAVADNIVSGCP